jgi:hypothetical protein
MDDLTRLLKRQDQLITRDQARGYGLSRSALRWRKDRGWWQEPLPGVFAAVTGSLTIRQRGLAALLYAGPQAQLTGVGALRIHGLRYLPSDPWVRVLVPDSQHRRSAGFARLHRTCRLDPHPELPFPLILASASRAVVDAARWCDDQRLITAMVADAVQRKLTTVEDLANELAYAPRRGSRLLRHAMAETAAGVRSVAEADLRSLLLRSTVLPKVSWNPRLIAVVDGMRLPTPDGWIAEAGIALEVDSREHHSSPRGWERTLARHNILARYGALVLHIVPAQVRRDPAAVLRQIEHTYAERIAAGVQVKITADG